MLERSTLPAEPLGPLGVAPDVWIFQLAQDLGQALFLGRVVKDTP